VALAARQPSLITAVGADHPCGNDDGFVCYIPVITILHSVVLGSVLCLSIAGTLAQAKPDQKALAKFITLGNPDDEALADHRLTVENVRQMFAVERELLKLLKEVPDLETRIGELRIWL
jgi:hypothetical protein